MGARAFLFAGGATGGHLYPGIAIAEKIREFDAGARLLFICSDKALDARLLQTEGVDFTPIPARPWSLRPRGLFRLLATWGTCVRSSRGVIRSLRAEGVRAHIVAMGGYVAAPGVQAAVAERAPITLVNLDAAPGKANRWIARHAPECFTAAALEDGRFKHWTLVPPIVRRAAIARGGPAACRQALGLNPSKPTLLVTGASQGARSINAMMIELVSANTEAKAALGAWQIFHQTGEVGEEGRAVADAYERAGIAAVVVPFCDDMASAWGSADLAISRCGAGNVGEVWANGIPTLFLPYPYHRDQHQRLNAMPLVNAGGAVIETDRIDPRANATAIGPALLNLIRSDAARQQLRAALRALGPADGAERVAKALLAS